MRKGWFFSILAGVALATTLAVIAVPQASYTVSAHNSDTRIKIEDGFEPPSITIQAGEIVEWRNKDRQVHSVADSSGSFASGPLTYNQKYMYTFTTPGTYTFSDEYSGFTGTVTVIEEGNPVVTGGTPPPETVAPAAGSLAIGDNFFTPASASITTGTTVTWTNNGDKSHSVTSDTGLFDSGIIGPGESFSYTFNSPGTFAYDCIFHGAQNGSVTVTGTAVETTPPPAQTTQPPPPPPAQTQAPVTSGQVINIGDNNYTPAIFSAATGTTVTWTNTGNMPHTVTSDTGLFDSGMLSPGGSFSYTFASAGTYAYSCLFHSGQNGSIAITGSATSAATAASQSATAQTSSGNPAALVSPAAPAPAPATPSQAAAQSISIGDNNYTPVTLSATRGTTVTWTNTGNMPHTVTSDTGLFDSGMLKPGESFSFTFTSAGDFAYKCLYHPGQAGTVTITNDEGLSPAGISLTTKAASPQSDDVGALPPALSSNGEHQDANAVGSAPPPPPPQPRDAPMPAAVTFGLGGLLGAGAVLTLGKLLSLLGILGR